MLTRIWKKLFGNEIIETIENKSKENDQEKFKNWISEMIHGIFWSVNFYRGFNYSPWEMYNSKHSEDIRVGNFLISRYHNTVNILIVDDVEPKLNFHVFTINFNNGYIDYKSGIWDEELEKCLIELSENAKKEKMKQELKEMEEKVIQRLLKEKQEETMKRISELFRKDSK